MMSFCVRFTHSLALSAVNVGVKKTAASGFEEGGSCHLGARACGVRPVALPVDIERRPHGAGGLGLNWAKN